MLHCSTATFISCLKARAVPKYWSFISKTRFRIQPVSSDMTLFQPDVTSFYITLSAAGTQGWSLSLVKRTMLGASPSRSFLARAGFLHLRMVPQKPRALCCAVYDASRVKARVEKEWNWWRSSEHKEEHERTAEHPRKRALSRPLQRYLLQQPVITGRQLVRRAHNMVCSLAAARPGYLTTAIKAGEEKKTI